MTRTAKKQQLIRNPEPEKKTSAKNEPITPMQMLQLAVQQGAELDKMQKLLDLQERWEKNEAQKAFVVALSAFKADPPKVYKTKHVSFDTSKGKTEYNHALLEDVVEILGSALTKHGLSFRWDTEQSEGMIKVICVLTHVQGHSERVSLQAGLDQSGGKNNIQALGSSITYLQRYTLFAATGMAARGMDDDGRTAEVVYITEKQAMDLNTLLEEVEADKVKFCRYMKIDSLEKLPSRAYSHAVALIEAKRKKS